MVVMLRQCCCCCKLKTGTIIIGAIYIVSVKISSNLLTVYRNGSLFSQEQTTLKVKILQFTCMVKLLAISIQITFEQSTAILVHCSKILREETRISKKNKPTFLYISE